MTKIGTLISSLVSNGLSNTELCICPHYTYMHSVEALGDVYPLCDCCALIIRVQNVSERESLASMHIIIFLVVNKESST